MKYLRVALKPAPAATVRPGERMRLGRKIVLAKRVMKEHGIVHINDGGGKYYGLVKPDEITGLLLPAPQAE